MRVFKRKGLATAIVGGLIIGFSIPLMAGWLYYVLRAEANAYDNLRTSHDRTLAILARNLREPLLTFSPEGASSAVRLLMQDEAVASVRVHSSVFEIDLANFARYEIQKDALLVSRRHILYNGEVLGFVEVAMSAVPMKKQLALQRRNLLFVFASMLFCGLVIVIPLVWFQALVPLGKLVEYADNIATGELSKPLEWHGGGEEFGKLAQAMESMRASLATSFREVEALAATDELTGIFNRRTFRERSEREVELAKRYGSLLSVVMFDVDDFKRINDNYGHSAGDVVLQNIARTVTEHVRNVDVLARWGGEEFVLLLPETGVEGAVAVAEKLRQVVETKVFYEDGPVTCSFGVSAFHGVDTLYTLLERVDGALYHAKQQGKNKVVQE